MRFVLPRARFAGRVPSPRGAEPVLTAAAEAYAHNLLAAGFLLEDPAANLGSKAIVRRLVGRAPGRRRGGDKDKQGFRRRLRRLLGDRPRHPASLFSPNDPIATNLDRIRAVFGLDGTEAAIVLFLAACSLNEDLRDLVQSLRVGGRPSMSHRCVAAATNLPDEAVSHALRGSAKLVKTGLVECEPYAAIITERLSLDSRLLDLLERAGLADADIAATFIPETAPPCFGPADFPHVAASFALITRLLDQAFAAGSRGINILLYGPTGTGKTELARTIAAAAGARLYQAGKDDGDGQSPSASQRLTSLALGCHLLERSRAVLLFDEMDDLFDNASRGFLHGPTGGQRISKQWFNILLETNPLPTIWTTNDTSSLDRAFLRRFSYAVEMREATASQRRRVLVRHLGETSALSGDDIDGIAHRFSVSPAQIGAAVAAARLLDRGTPARATLEALLEPAQTLTSPRPPGRAFHIGAYDPAVLNTTMDIAALADKLATRPPGQGPGLSLCLYGPPGTGKSELVRYLAHRMDRPVVARRVSDVVSMWVGETERNVAEAFRAAAAENAVLLFDEADSFLRDRRSARQAWEITQVNEFLQQLEDGSGVVACTTNLIADLDQAVLRRFTFKIRLDYLTPTQAYRLLIQTLERLGGHAPGKADHPSVAPELARLETITPGDFAAVARRLTALGERPDARRLLDELRSELEAKEAAPRRAGFAGR